MQNSGNHIKSNYIGTSKAAEILGFNQNYISTLCRKKVFKTAEQDAKGKPWRILESEVYEYCKKISNRKGGSI